MTLLSCYQCVLLFQVKVWVKELRKMLGNDITLCIAGNKVDLDKERHVTVDEAETYVLFERRVANCLFLPSIFLSLFL